MTTNWARIEIRHLASFTTDPLRAGEGMLEACKLGVKRTKKVLSVNLLKGLRKRRTGTAVVEKMAKILTEEKRRNERVVVQLLDIALKSSEERAIRAKKAADESMKEARGKLPPGWLRTAFRNVVRKEVQSLWDAKKKKNSQKKDHLEAKHKPRKEEDYIRGIPISDRALGEEDREIKVTSIGVELSEDEKAFLKLPKSATDFVRIDEEKVETNIQVMAAKLRMALREQAEGGGVASQGLEEQEAVLASRRVFDREAGEVDFRKLRVTDFK